MRWLVLVALIGCPKSAPAPALGPAAEDAATEEIERDTAPLPYTADQIARSWREGLVVVWQITAGDDVSWSRWEVVEATAEAATLAYWDSNAEHEKLGEARQATDAYVELRDHARFPESRTTIAQVEYASPWGLHKAHLYTVIGTPEDPEAIRRYWFGHDTPGAPLRHTIESGGQVVMEMKMMRREYGE